MIQIGPHRIYAGDCHTHWGWDPENPTLYLAGMKRLGLDFIVLGNLRKHSLRMDQMAREYHTGIRVFPGLEVTQTNIHIMAMLDDHQDGSHQMMELPLPDSPPLAPGEEVPPAEMLRRIKSRSRLTIIAHPTPKWTALWDGKSYQPMFDFYRRGLCDAIQIENTPAPYLEAVAQGLQIPVVGGIDCHGCGQLTNPPDYLFDNDFPPLRFIQPCSGDTTLVFAQELTADAIANAIKTGNSCVFQFETGKFYGPPKLVEILTQGNYFEKYRQMVARHHQVSLSITKPGLIVGDAAEVTVTGLPADATTTLYHFHPDNDFVNAQSTQNTRLPIPSVPDYGHRPLTYLPLGIRCGEDSFFFGLRVTQPITVQLFEHIEQHQNQLRYFVECETKNLTNQPRQVTLRLEIEGVCVSDPSTSMTLAPQAVQTHRFELAAPARPGFEYLAKLHWQTGAASLTHESLVSFVPCRQLAANEDPWLINDDEALIIDHAFQIYERRGTWRGPGDLSMKATTRWDSKNWYFYAQVTDDVFHQTWTDWETFWGDSIQIALGIGKQKPQSYGTNYELCMALTPIGPEIMVWNSPLHGTSQLRTLLTQANLHIHRDETTKLTTYRLAIPWEHLAPLQPGLGNKLQLGILHNDNDGPPGTWHVRAFWGGNLTHKDMSKTHTLTLI